MNRERFLKSIIILENVPDEEFDMQTYFAASGANAYCSLKDAEDSTQNLCGTTACYAGEIQFNFASTSRDKEIDADIFAGNWLKFRKNADFDAFHMKNMLFANDFSFYVSNPHGEIYLSEITRETVIRALVDLYNCAGNPSDTLSRYAEYNESRSIDGSFRDWAKTQKQLPKSKQTWAAV